MLIDAFTDWSKAPDDELAAEIERLWKLRVFTTRGIAGLLMIPEARVWNLRVRSEQARAA